MKPIPQRCVVVLEKLQAALDQLRQEYGVSDRGKILTQFDYDDGLIIARANGFGGASLRWVEQCGEDEMLLHDEYLFEDEQDAYLAAECLRRGLDAMTISRAEYFGLLKQGKKPYLDSEVLTESEMTEGQ